MTALAVAEKADELQSESNSDKAIDIFAKNAFRTLGVCGDATPKEISSAASSLRRANKIGKKRETTWDLPWFAPLNRTENEIRNAENNLASPESRITERLFWFYHPTELGESVQELCQEWLKEANPWSLHDVAVLRTMSGLLVDREFKNESVWTEVIESWIAVGKAGEYWDLLCEIDKEKNFEPAISADEIRRLQKDCLKVALNPLIVRAKHFIEKNNFIVLSRFLKIIRLSSLTEKTKKYFELEVLVSLEDEFTTFCESFETDCNKSVEEEFQNTKQNRTILIKLEKRFSLEIEKELDKLKEFLPEDSEILRNCKERAAESAQCLASVFVWANNVEKSADILKKASTLAAGSSLVARIDDQINTIEEIIQAEQAAEDYKESYFKNESFQVVLRGRKYSIPSVCPCCLQETDRKVRLTYEWEENYVVFKRTKSVFLDVPYCKDCSDHESELTWKRFQVIFVSALMTILLGLLFRAQDNLLALTMFTVLFSVVSGYVCSIFLKLKELKLHCTRGCAIELVSANDNQMVFRFWNPLYAQAFAKFNNCDLTVRKSAKHTFGSSLFSGKSRTQIISWSVILSFLPLLMVSFSDLEKSNASNRQEREANLVENSSTENAVNPSVSEDIKNTRKKLDDTRKQISKLESELKKMKLKVESNSEQIGDYKTSIKSFEQSISNNYSIDEGAYEAAINAHNKLVRENNSQIISFKAKYAQYKGMLEDYSVLHEQYKKMANL